MEDEGLTSLAEPEKNESFKPSKHLGNRQARNVAKAAVAKDGSCRGVFQALAKGGSCRGGAFKPWIETKEGSCRGFLKLCIDLGKANQRNWHRNIIWQQTWVELRQQAGQERGKSRCGKG